jgi:glycosyltransferase involved in cell wall biosynthesis
MFWHTDPFLHLAVRKANKILCMNSQAPAVLRLKTAQYQIMPSVAAEPSICVCKTCTPGCQIDVPKPDGFTVLSAGRFVPLKGFDLTIRSFAQFYRQLPVDRQAFAKLVLVGSGPQRKLLEKIIGEEQITGSVEMIEWLPREELLKLYKKSHVFLFPSHEGAGMVVAEAMSHALPVVCLDNAGPGEFISPNSGLSVACGSYDQTVQRLSGCLTQLYSQPDFYQQESSLALQRFDEHLRWDIRGSQLLEIYNGVCRKKQAREKRISVNMIKIKANR